MILIGSYTESHANGIYMLDIDKRGTISLVKEFESGENPSYLTLLNTRVVSVHEWGREANISSFNLSGGKLIKEREGCSGGIGPCHLLVIDKDYLLISNYSDGSLSLLNSDFKLLDRVKHSGCGKDTSRQESAHVHSVAYIERYKTIYAVDLGIDRVVSYIVDSDLKLKKVSSFKLEPGDGPRMMITDEDSRLGYIVNELSNTVTVVSLKDDGSLKEIGRYSTLKRNFKGENLASHISFSPCSRYILISNRGDDSIISFKIDGEKLIDPVWSYCGGKWPRHFTFTEDGKHLLIANQNSDNISCFNFDKGRVQELLSVLTIKKPTIILPVNLKNN